MGVREEHLLKKIFDRQMDIHSGYLVYFDDVCMNEFVQGYVTNVGISVGMGSASVTLTYAPQFKSIDTVDDSRAYIDSNDGIQNGTSLRIFAENIFSKKYHIIFDGIIKSRSVSRNPHSFSLVFTATDYMYWLSRSIVPITIPAEHQIWPGERIRWKGQGVFVDNLNAIATVTSGQLVEKTISEYWHDVLKKSLVNNSTVYSDNNSVASFDDAINRVSIMGDINPKLVAQKIIDLVVTANAVFADTAYVALNNVTTNLLMEFFQDIDGVIRVKPPFWNEPVLKNYIIDPMMIKSGSENTNWESFYTRVIAQGGLEEWENGEVAESAFTPVGVYVGEYKNKNGGKWADYLTYDSYEFFDPDNDGVPGGDPVKNYITNSAGEGYAWDHLIKTRGLSRAIASGIVANILYESRFNPEAQGDYENNAYRAFGLFQWRNDAKAGQRWQAVVNTFMSNYRVTFYIDNLQTEVSEVYRSHKAYTKSTIGATDKEDKAYIEFQIDYFLTDIGYDVGLKGFKASSTSFRNIKTQLQQCSDTAEGAAKAAEIICSLYEIPANLDQELVNRRAAAKEYYTQFRVTRPETTGVAWSIEKSRVYNNKSQSNEYVAGTTFKVSDFKCGCGCGTTYISEEVVQILQKIKDSVKAGSFSVTSGYRCEAHNTTVGGATYSRHLTGGAVDFKFANGNISMKDLCKRIRDNINAYVSDNGQIISYAGYYSGGWIHIDVQDSNKRTCVDGL